MITRGATINDGVYFGLREAARNLGIEVGIQATGASSGTDADPMVRTGSGTATGLISVPCRYMHSPNELLSLRDVEDASRIVAEFVRTVSPDSDFRPGSLGSSSH